MFIEKDKTDGLIQKTHHLPNGDFQMDSKGSLRLPLSWVIGGPEKIGDGWKMLMECLAVGRGVSLPATANGTAKAITYGISNYIKHRNQFKIPIGKMEAVQEKFMEMVYQSLVIEASVHFTNHILDSGSTPSVITAIMKQQTTERARKIIQSGMDIYEVLEFVKVPIISVKKFIKITRRNYRRRIQYTHSFSYYFLSRT